MDSYLFKNYINRWKENSGVEKNGLEVDFSDGVVDWNEFIKAKWQLRFLTVIWI